MIIDFIIKILSLFAVKKPIQEVEYIPLDYDELDKAIKEAVKEPIPVKTNRERLYDMAKDCLLPPHDVSPDDKAADEFGCVDSFDHVHRLTFGTFINGTKNRSTVSTIEAYKILSASPLWERVAMPLPGDAIISVTGSGRAKVTGHIGICGKTHIMSNNSWNGHWEANFDYDSWRKYYILKGGLTTAYFRRK